MALTENGGGNMIMPVGPMYGGGDGFGNGFGGEGWWILLLFILLGNGAWGNGFGGGWGAGNELYPWMNQAEITSNGFQNQLMNDNVTSIRDGVNNLATQLCNSTSNIQMALANGFAGVEQGANTRQMADMQQNFALQSQLAQCCCDNRLTSADLKYTIATENCADRAALSDGVRDIIASQTASTQRILDQLCNDKIEQKNDIIAQLRSELQYARGQASQDVQTAQILANNAAQTAALEQYLNPAPIPAYVVQNPNCCTNACGCGCGCGM